MGIINREMDISEQKEVFSRSLDLTVGASAGVAFPIAVMPFPGVIKKVAIAAQSLSSTPAAMVQIKRWSSDGLTTIQGLAATLSIGQFSTVGYQGFSLQSAGNSLVQVQTGDVVEVATAFVANSAATNSSISLVVQALQDIKQHFGSSN